MKKLFFFLIFSISFYMVVSCSNNSKTQISCELKDGTGLDFHYKKIYLLDLNKSEVLDVTSTKIVTGNLTVKENIYQIYFPGDKDHFASLEKINRYTGQITIEIGKVFNSKTINYTDVGVCTFKSNKPLF